MFVSGVPDMFSEFDMIRIDPLKERKKEEKKKNAGRGGEGGSGGRTMFIKKDSGEE